MHKFLQDVQDQREVVQRARIRLLDLQTRAVEELSPVKRGEEVQTSYHGRSRGVVESIKMADHGSRSTGVHATVRLFNKDGKLGSRLVEEIFRFDDEYTK